MNASNIIHAILSPVTTIAQVEQVCNEAKEFGFPKICVPPVLVKKAKEFTAGTSIQLTTVIGFPFGYSAIEAKVAEIVLAMIDGADELDVVINIAALKNNDWQYLANELNIILPLVKSKNKIIKIIIEVGLLTNDEIKKCCDLYGIAGVDFLVTATGFQASGASRENVQLIRRHLADAVKIVAAGNIITYQFATDLLEDGASFILGNDSINIMAEKKAE